MHMPAQAGRPLLPSRPWEAASLAWAAAGCACTQSSERPRVPQPGNKAPGTPRLLQGSSHRSWGRPPWPSWPTWPCPCSKILCLLCLLPSPRCRSAELHLGRFPAVRSPWLAGPPAGPGPPCQAAQKALRKASLASSSASSPHLLLAWRPSGAAQQGKPGHPLPLPRASDRAVARFPGAWMQPQLKPLGPQNSTHGRALLPPSAPVQLHTSAACRRSAGGNQGCAAGCRQGHPAPACLPP